MAGPDEHLWVALVTFERLPGPNTVLAEEEQGACGWLGCVATDLDQLRERISTSLAAERLWLVEIERATVASIDEIEELDEQLAANFQARDPENPVIWGTLFVYLADGEA